MCSLFGVSAGCSCAIVFSDCLGRSVMRGLETGGCTAVVVGNGGESPRPTPPVSPTAAVAGSAQMYVFVGPVDVV